MTISVHKAVALPTDSVVKLHALPVGFPLVVVDEQEKIIEPVLLFQIDKLLKRGGRHWDKVRNTGMAEAYDLRDWFDYLTYVTWENPKTLKLETGKPWDLATESDYIAYRNTMQEIVSPHTNRHLASNTISRRQSTVEKFYKFAIKKRWYVGEFVISKVKKGRDAPSSLVATGEKKTTDTESKSEYREPTEFGEPVRPLTDSEWNRIKCELGPLPSEGQDDLRPSRDRIGCELAVGTGMRVDEVTSLTVSQIRNLYKRWQEADEYEQAEGFFGFYIIKTKRLKPRDVLVPGYLIPELMAYIDGERQISIELGQDHAKRKGKKFKPPTSLFVNLPNSGQHAGKAVQASSLSLGFKNACLNCDITHLVEKIDIDSNERYHESLARHRYHDLRHTFAVWTYHWKKANGDTEPWKEIQTLLGHASLETTLQIYLRIVEIDRRNAGKMQYVAKRAMGEADA